MRDKPMFDLYDQKGNKISHDDAWEFIKTLDRLVRQSKIRETIVGKVRVSTIHLPASSDPARFETAALGELQFTLLARYHTRAEAIAGHKKWVAQLGRAG